MNSHSRSVQVDKLRDSWRDGVDLMIEVVEYGPGNEVNFFLSVFF